MSESREDVQSRLRAGGTPSIRGEQADWGGRMPPDYLRLTWGFNLTSGGSSIEALEAVPHQLLGKKAFIGLLPLFHSWLRPYSFHASA